MKMRNKELKRFNLFLFTITTVLYYSCRKPVIHKEIIEKHDTLQYSWKYFPDIFYNENNCYQVFSYNGKIAIVTENYIFAYDSINTNNRYYSYFSGYNSGYYVPFNKGLFFKVSNFGNIIAYHLTPQNIATPISAVLFLRNFDNSFFNLYNKDFVSMGGQCAINDSFSLLVAGYDTNDIRTMSQYSIYYIKGSYVNSSYKSYTFNSVKKIKLNSNPFGSNYILLSGLKYNFIIGFKDSIYIIRPDYTLKKRSPRKK
ncbi:MAG: hypothetical protein KatS3mg027_0436 [Bacteroidia bacterium]|nr:MAG: hypothetical protein KatS3mg027_0436 [Bacteroidia bacterium]